MDLSHILSLAAALSWTLASLFGHQPSVILGSLHFNRIRMVVSAGLLCIMMVVTGNSWTLPDGFWLPILASALIGVVIGDFFLFVTMRRLGPRRTGILFAANAPLAAMLGWLFLSEPLSILKILAVLIGFCGICLAIIYGKRRDLLHVWETVTQPLWIGVGAGLIAALGQAVGVLLLRPVMEAGGDPMMATLIRVSAAACFFWLTWTFTQPKTNLSVYKDFKLCFLIIANSFFGLSFGVYLLLTALETGHVADVTILSSFGPVMILPFVWYQTRICPAWGAWGGAGLVVLSSALLVLQS